MINVVTFGIKYLCTQVANLPDKLSDAVVIYEQMFVFNQVDVFLKL